MNARVRRVLADLIPVVVLLATLTTARMSSASSAISARNPVATPAASPWQCPITTPNGSSPPDERPNSLQHGNGAMWTELWPEGIVRVQPDQVEADGTLTMKFPWWRAPGIRGVLIIEGRRLDASAPPLRARTAEYESSGFQPSTLFFPTAGCWEVTAKTGQASLTFVTSVVLDRPQATPDTSTPNAALRY